MARYVEETDEAQIIEPKEWKPSLHQVAILLSLAIISFMISLDATIIITSLSAMVTDLKATSTEGFWIGTSYLLSCASPMPFIAALSDIFGRSICLLSSLALFTIGSVLCSVAHTIKLLLIGRVVQGIGGGGIVILCLVITTDIVPLRYRPKYIGIILGAWALGTCIGPVIGGALVTKASWRWVFYLMFPFCGIGFATIPFVLSLKPKTETLAEKLRRVDWIGGFIFVSSVTAFLVAISWGGTQQPWNSFRTLVPLLIGIAGIIVAMIWEIYGAKEPFLRHRLFHCPSSYAAYLGGLVQGLLLYGQLYYVPLYFLAVKQASPIMTGVNIFPTTCSLVPASIVVGAIITRVNHYRWAIWAGWFMISLGCGLTIMWDVNTPTVDWVWVLILLGFGHGFVLNAQNFATQAICLPDDEASAAAMYSFLRNLGMALGVGIGGSIFQNVMKYKLVQLGLPSEIARVAESYIAILKQMPASSQKDKILEAYVYGFRGVYIFFCAISLLAGVVSLFVKHFDMNKELKTDHTLQENRVSRLLQQWEAPQLTRSVSLEKQVDDIAV